VFDRAYLDRYPVAGCSGPQPWMVQADTVAGLAAAAGIDPAQLAEATSTAVVTIDAIDPPDPEQGQRIAMSIAAVVLGGTLLLGGRGSIWGAIGGVAILAVVEVKLLAKYVKAGPPELTEDDLNPPTKIGGDTRDADKPMAFSY